VKKIILSVAGLLVLCVLILIINYIIVDKNQNRISQGKPIIREEPAKQALLVIDVQEGITGTLATNEYYIAKSEALIHTINDIADSSSAHKIPVIYVKNEIKNFLINILNNSLAKGSKGAELDSRLKLVSDYVITKDKGDAFSNPLLDSVLINFDINKIVFVGLDLAYCVNNTIQAAVNRNYAICVIRDAVITRSDSLYQEMLDKFSKSGIEIISSNDYFRNIHQ
jgi:nicotinamidase/pyrazinamidase